MNLLNNLREAHICAYTMVENRCGELRPLGASGSSDSWSLPNPHRCFSTDVNATYSCTHSLTHLSVYVNIIILYSKHTKTYSHLLEWCIGSIVCVTTTSSSTTAACVIMPPPLDHDWCRMSASFVRRFVSVSWAILFFRQLLLPSLAAS